MRAKHRLGKELIESTDCPSRPGKVVSPEVAEIADKGLGFVKGFLARDPDRYGLQLIEK
jgi:hypothetical protein